MATGYNAKNSKIRCNWIFQIVIDISNFQCLVNEVFS